MIRKQISLFLKNVPGELGHLASLLAKSGINIEALSIQDSSAYVKELMKARGTAIKRIASTHSYESMLRDSAEFALIRVIVDKVNEAVELLAENDYIFNIFPVISIDLENHPGALAEVTNKFGEAGVNIKYVYGSAVGADNRVLFIICPDDIELADKVFDQMIE